MKNCELWTWDKATSTFIPIPGNGSNPAATPASVAQLGSRASKSTQVSAVISTTWAGTDAPYTQTISVAGATSTNVIEITLPTNTTKDNFYAFNALCLGDGGQATGQITLESFGIKNTADIPIIVIIRGDM